jgi:Lrp/AsnC family transcriptional regulator, leucine-responsive regulatory protein
MLKKTLGLDDKDAIIVSRSVRDPDVSQAELAQDLGISQPSVNVRVNKLKKRGILSQTMGIEFNRTNMSLARVDFTATHASEILKGLKECSFFVNGFIMSGTNNTSILVVGHDLKKIESIVNKHLRANPNVKDIQMNVVVTSAKPFVCSIDPERETKEECQDLNSCDGCQIKS